MDSDNDSKVTEGEMTTCLQTIIFRQRPADLFFAQAQEKQAGILARVPLASGLLSGKMNRARIFPADDFQQLSRKYLILKCAHI